VIVLEELEQGIATLFEVCRNHGVTPVTLGPWRVVRRDTRDATRLKRRDWLGTNGSLGKEIDSGWWQTSVKALDKARKPDREEPIVSR